MTTVSNDVRPASPPAPAIRMVRQLDGTLLEDTWKLYEEAFRELNTLAVQRHMMYRHEFDDVMADTRWRKYLAFDDGGTLIGVSTFTNQLDAVPLISQAYFERHWPQHYAEQRVWWIGFVAVAPAGRGLRTFYRLVQTMEEVSGSVNGINGMDFCRFNEDVINLASITKKLLGRIADANGRTVTHEKVDYQGYHIYELLPRPVA